MNEKQTNHAGTVSKLLSFANDCRGKLIGSMLLAILGVLCGMVPYFCVAMLTADFFYEVQTLKSIIIWSALAIVGLLLKCLLTTVSTMKSHEAAFTILKNIRVRLVKKMERVSMGVMIDTPTGTLKTLVVDIVEKLEKPLAHILPEMTSNICTPIAILILLFIYDWRMALATLAVIPVGLVIMLGQMKGYKEKSELQMQAGNEMNNAIIEYVNGIEVIKAFNQSATSYKKFSDAVRNFRDCTLDWWKGCWIYSSIGYSVISSTLILSLPLGAYWYMTGSLEFSTFITCIILSLGIAGPILAASQFVEDFSAVYQSIEQVSSFLNQAELHRPTTDVTLSDSQFEFCDVSFSYNNEIDVLKHIKTMRIAMEYQDRQNYLNHETMREIVEEMTEVEAALQKLEFYVSQLEPKQAEVIRAHYFEGITWAELQKRMHVTSRALLKRRDAAIEELASMYLYLGRMKGGNI